MPSWTRYVQVSRNRSRFALVRPKGARGVGPRRFGAGPSPRLSHSVNRASREFPTDYFRIHMRIRCGLSRRPTERFDGARLRDDEAQRSHDVDVLSAVLNPQRLAVLDSQAEEVRFSRRDFLATRCRVYARQAWLPRARRTTRGSVAARFHNRSVASRWSCAEYAHPAHPAYDRVVCSSSPSPCRPSTPSSSSSCSSSTPGEASGTRRARS